MPKYMDVSLVYAEFIIFQIVIYIIYWQMMQNAVTLVNVSV